MKDRFGKVIRRGDVVVTAITINHDNYKGFSFVTWIVKQEGRVLVGDGTWTTCRISEVPRKQIVKLHPDTDLREVEAMFIREFGPK
jgi:hypothetical protein